MSANKRGFEDQGSESYGEKRTRSAHGSDIRSIAPMALDMALGGQPGYNTNMPSNLALPMPLPQQAPTNTSPENLTLDTPIAPSAPSYSPFGATYHHSGASNAYTARFTNLCGMRIGNTPFEHVNISIPENMSKEDAATLKAKWDAELQLQKINCPALPRSNVPELPPKEHIGDPLPFPQDGTLEEQQQVTSWNDWLSTETQRVDRSRNNQAAKKSRETRIEALERSRNMLNHAAAERDWLRLKLIQQGGDPGEWDEMDQNLKDRIVEVIEQRVKESDQRLSEEKKKEEAKKRAERTRKRQESQRNRGVQNARPAVQNLATSPDTVGFFSPEGGIGVDHGAFLGNLDFLGTP